LPVAGSTKKHLVKGIKTGCVVKCGEEETEMEGEKREMTRAKIFEYIILEKFMTEEYFVKIVECLDNTLFNFIRISCLIAAKKLSTLFQLKKIKNEKINFGGCTFCHINQHG